MKNTVTTREFLSVVKEIEALIGRVEQLLDIEGLSSDGFLAVTGCVESLDTAMDHAKLGLGDAVSRYTED